MRRAPGRWSWLARLPLRLGPRGDQRLLHQEMLALLALDLFVAFLEIELLPYVLVEAVSAISFEKHTVTHIFTPYFPALGGTEDRVAQSHADRSTDRPADCAGRP